MEENNIYNALEIINKEKYELKKSREYKLGKYLTYILSINLKELIKDLRNRRVKKIIQKKYVHHNMYDYNQDLEQNIDYKKCKIVAYTCIIGDYDNLQIPLINFENVDYYIITNNADKYEKYKDIYKIIELPTEILENGNIIANRYAKFHPKEFFKDYDYAIYLDGNVRIIADIRKFIARCSVKTGIAMHIHRERNCIYEEAEVCKLLKRGNAKKIEEQVQNYRREGLPEKFGMNEATIIVSDLKNIEASRLLNEWYLEFLKSESLRDQLAWPYILWKNSYKITDIGNLGSNIYEDYKVEMVKHDNF